MEKDKCELCGGSMRAFYYGGEKHYGCNRCTYAKAEADSKPKRDITEADLRRTTQMVRHKIAENLIKELYNQY